MLSYPCIVNHLAYGIGVWHYKIDLLVIAYVNVHKLLNFRSAIFNPLAYGPCNWSYALNSMELLVAFSICCRMHGSHNHFKFDSCWVRLFGSTAAPTGLLYACNAL